MSDCHRTLVKFSCPPSGGNAAVCKLWGRDLPAAAHFFLSFHKSTSNTPVLCSGLIDDYHSHRVQFSVATANCFPVRSSFKKGGYYPLLLEWYNRLFSRFVVQFHITPTLHSSCRLRAVRAVDAKQTCECNPHRRFQARNRRLLFSFVMFPMASCSFARENTVPIWGNLSVVQIHIAPSNDDLSRGWQTLSALRRRVVMVTYLFSTQAMRVQFPSFAPSLKCWLKGSHHLRSCELLNRVLSWGPRMAMLVKSKIIQVHCICR